MTLEKNSWDPIWEEIFKSQNWGQYPAEDLIRFVARNFYSARDRSQIKILEIGCGPGPNLWYAAREGFSVYGIDGSPYALDQARKRLDRDVPGWKGQLIQGNLQAIPFTDGFFDGVIDNECTYSNAFENAQKIFLEAARVLKTGGKLFSRAFATGSWGDETGKNIGHHTWLTGEGPTHEKGLTRFTSEDDIPALLGKDFSLLEISLLTRAPALPTTAKTIKEWLVTAVKKSPK